ncbi:MAG: hypothetical protein CFH21_00041 [Alphaproteobacteria bacterium MarineAlpha5_Bin11]|nr:MAG: hypothetical protein CFH21_00041 [Alphaproteobacteria bacterium MarineAlpha5_Bin11]PPR52193.1 MAG: hypothetical protein CFH20_00098 [Alphaproteobacteria bacterium MarineAlpha5_Bin10]|tara:strand:- start:809 stop:1015 length:207 start_codon:yes stop_codon:yes gene_type:complete
MILFLKNVYIVVVSLLIFLPFGAQARCAVCVVNGMSGASIAVIVILSSFIILAIANWGLKKIIEKKKL